MGNGIYSALSGAMADIRKIEVISHNLANANSVGFKQFQMSKEAVKGKGDSQELSYTRATEPQIDFTPGPLQSTENPMDIALTDGVYMTVKDGGQDAYRRGGSLMIRPDGMLVTATGQAVMGKKTPIRIPQGKEQLVDIATDGTVNVDGIELDKIRLVEFADPKALQKGPGSTVRDAGGAGPQKTKTKNSVMTGYIEEGNLNVIAGMTDLIAAHRSYEAALKAVETFAHIEKRTSTNLGAKV